MLAVLDELKSPLSFYIYDKDQDRYIDLEETDPGAGCKNVRLEKRKNDYTLTIEGDRRKDNSGLFTQFAEARKVADRMCDYIIFCPSKNKLFVLLIELKSNSVKAWQQQVLNAEVVVKNLLSNVESKLSLNTLEHTVIRCILFSNQNNKFSIYKKHTTKIPPPIYKDREGIMTAFKHCGQSYKLNIFLR